MNNRRHQGSISSRDSQKSKASNDSGVVLDLDPDFLPVKIHVYRNGDTFDNGTEVVVTRREFKHWFGFLDFVSKRIKAMKTIQKLYTFQGDEVEGFDELKSNGQYVACWDAFKKISYGKSKPPQWRPVTRQMNYHDPYGIDSHESLEIHLKKLGFESETGTSFPDDNPANHNRGKSHPRRIIIPQGSRRGSMVHSEKKHDNNKTSLSLPKISTSHNLTTEPYDYDRGSRPDSDPEKYSSSRSRGHRSTSRDRRNSSRSDDDYDRRRRHRSNRESSRRDYDDAKYYKSDDKYYKSDDKYYKSDDKYYKSDDKYYKSDDKYYKSDDKYYKSDDKYYKSDDKYYKNDDKYYRNDDKYYKSDRKDDGYYKSDKYNDEDADYYSDKSRRRSKKADDYKSTDRKEDEKKADHNGKHEKYNEGVYM